MKTRAITQDDLKVVQYTSQANYTASTGKPCPPYDPNLPKKYWEAPPEFDMNAGELIGYHNIPAYSNVAGPGLKPTTTFKLRDGKPYLDDRYLNANQIGVNIPPDKAAFGDENYPRLDYVPPPMKPLADGNSLRLQFGGNTLLIQEGPDDAPAAGGGFTDFDRAMLTALYNALPKK